MKVQIALPRFFLALEHPMMLSASIKQFTEMCLLVELPKQLHHSLFATRVPICRQLNGPTHDRIIRTVHRKAFPRVAMCTTVLKHRPKLDNAGEILVAVFVL
jgi:hypothetical protein